MTAISSIDRLRARVTITEKRADGTAVIPPVVDVTLLPMRTFPNASTVWSAPATYTPGVAEAIIAGPYANPSGALVIPTTGADLWVRVTDGDQVVTAMVDRITIKT
jgi:hypothetical protein